ncbi:hypothetical protein KUW04_12180 [Halomonas denitrificans]|nr:hypothetical protein [Halomonas denitrificans]
MRYSKLSLALLSATSLCLPLSALGADPVMVDFSEQGVEGNLGTSMVVDAPSGVAAKGLYLNPDNGRWERANLYRRNITDKDEGLGVCNPLEAEDNGGDCPGPGGGGDINELSNQLAPEFIYLKRPKHWRWVSVTLSSLDGNDGAEFPETGQIWSDTDGNPNNGGLVLLAEFTGNDDNVEQVLDIAALGAADARFLVLRPVDIAPDGTDTNNDFLVKAAVIEKKPKEPPMGGQGCTPGYWKQPHHFDSWTMYDPHDTFYMAFGSDLFGMNKTLLQVLSQGGGKEYAMGRHAVAALLNALSDGVSYKYSKEEIIAAVQGAHSGSYNHVKNAFEYQNEMGCPLN